MGFVVGACQQSPEVEAHLQYGPCERPSGAEVLRRQGCSLATFWYGRLFTTSRCANYTGAICYQMHYQKGDTF